MWSTDLLLLLILCILTLISTIVSVYRTVFTIGYTKMQLKMQIAEAQKLEEQMSEMKQEGELMAEMEKSGYMTELGKKGGMVKQQNTLERKAMADIMNTEEAQAALAVAEAKFPEAHAYVMKNPHMIGTLINLYKKYAMNSDNASLFTQQGSTPNSNRNGSTAKKFNF